MIERKVENERINQHNELKIKRKKNERERMRERNRKERKKEQKIARTNHDNE